MTNTRLLLPFTENINTQALSYAVQLARQRQATLVPLALIRVKPGKTARLEHIQQAQDFLEFVSYKAAQQGVHGEQMRLFTDDCVRGIEAVAAEMGCETVILFVSPGRSVLVDLASIRELLDHAACQIHLVLFPPKRARRDPLHIPLPEHTDEKSAASPAESFAQEKTSLISSLVSLNRRR